MTQFGSQKAFGFGRTTCGSDCFDANVTKLIIHFPSPTYVGYISFKEMELFGNWGSEGFIIVDGEGQVYIGGDSRNFGREPVNDWQADTTFRTKAFLINKTVETIELRSWDITNQSEIFIDDLQVFKDLPPLTDGLVAYYPFNGNANDESGNGNNGTVYGAVLTTDRFGNLNSAYNFNGIDNYIQAAMPPIAQNNSFTISFWIQYEWQPHRIWMLYFGYNDQWQCSGGENNGLASLINVSNEWGEGLAQGDTQIGFFCGDQNRFNISMLQGNWLHVVAVYDAQNSTLKSYLNGNLIDSDESLSPKNIQDDPLFIGKPSTPYMSDSYFKGIIDEVRIYNRALNEAQIQALYSGYVPCTYTYSDWGDCQPDGTQTRAVLTASPDGGTGTPELSQSCTYVPPSPNIEVSPSFHNFGQVAKGTSSDYKQFTIINTGAGNLWIYEIGVRDTDNYNIDVNDNIITGCHTRIFGNMLAPGGSCTFSVKFHPTIMGPIDSYISISSNDPNASGYYNLSGDTLYTYPIGGIKYSKCPVDGIPYNPNDPETGYSMVWTGRYTTASNRCEDSGGHPGVDIRQSVDPSKIVRAIGRGIVLEKGNYGNAYGNYVIIQHDNDPEDGVIYSEYAHLESIDAAVPAKGHQIEKGQQLGIMGGSGGWPVHLHFQIDRNPKLVKKGNFNYYQPYWPTYSITNKAGKIISTSSYPAGDDLKKKNDGQLTTEQRNEAAENVRQNTINPIERIEKY